MASDTPVSLLNIICTQNEVTPVYNLIAKEGRVHAPVFTYQIQLMDMTEEGSGQSKKKAKHIAARNMLKRMLAETDLIEDKKPVLACLKRCDEEDIAEGLALMKQAGKLSGGGPDGQVVETASKPCSASSDASTVSGLEEANPIGKLQEICMKKYWHPPVYEDIGEKGAPHERVFHVCTFHMGSF